MAAIARAIRYAVGVAGSEHVGLGSDFDGAVPVPFDVTGLVQLTDALIETGFSDEEIAAVMGRNARRVVAEVLPAGRASVAANAALPTDQISGAISAAARAAPSVSTGR